ncbi:MAG TPA: site-2 protease family protein [Anaerolineae bacterium]|nr:site-2 protease family protein [Anaerolineae bacterium]
MLFIDLDIQILYLIIALLMAISVHESSHAWMANLLGDPTAKEAGRISLNPLAHLDPLGTLMMLLVGVGWGKPVRVDATRLRHGPKTGMALVGAAGPAANFALATLLAIPLRLHLVPFRPWMVAGLPISWGEFAFWLIWFNLILGLFNLLPFTPLDGSRILGFFLPERWFYWLARYERVALMIFLALFIPLIMGERMGRVQVISSTIIPAMKFLWRALTGFQSTPLGL